MEYSLLPTQSVINVNASFLWLVIINFGRVSTKWNHQDQESIIHLSVCVHTELFIQRPSFRKYLLGSVCDLLVIKLNKCLCRVSILRFHNVLSKFIMRTKIQVEREETWKSKKRKRKNFENKFTYRTAVDGSKIQFPCIRCLLHRLINVLLCSWMSPKHQPHTVYDSLNRLYHQFAHWLVLMVVDIESLVKTKWFDKINGIWKQ